MHATCRSLVAQHKSFPFFYIYIYKTENIVVWFIIIRIFMYRKVIIYYICYFGWEKCWNLFYFRYITICICIPTVYLFSIIMSQSQHHESQLNFENYTLWQNLCLITYTVSCHVSKFPFEYIRYTIIIYKVFLFSI